MIFLKSVSPAYLVRKSLLALAAAGLIVSGIDTAQASTDSSVDSSGPSFSEAEESLGSGTLKGDALPDRLGAQTIASQTVLADGTYLFGQTAEPNVMGSTYAIVSVENNRTIGAFYQPRSSFDCFSGEVLPDRLAINIVDSYEGTVYPYSVSLVASDALAAGSAANPYTLEGFHQLDNLSDQDREILATCQGDLAQ